MMKKTIVVLCSIVLTAISQSNGAILLNMDVGNLYVADTSTAFPSGGLIQLVASTLDNTFSTPTAGSFTGNSDDVVLMSFAANNILGPGSFEGPITFALSGNLNTGDLLILRWYPTLTMADAASGPPAGARFGQFRTDIVQDFSSIAWVVPNDNFVEALNFLTMAQGGANPESAGVANLFVVAIPEPATYAFLMVGLAGAAFIRRRTKAA